MKDLPMIRILGAVFLIAIFSINAQGFTELPSDTVKLKPKAVYGQEAKYVAYILDNNHYRKLTLIKRILRKQT
jgi:hypothetical protein